MHPIRVDFYLLNEDSKESVFLFACRFIEKAYRRNHKIFVFCDTQDDAETLDELLWTYKEDAFIPHNLQGEGPEPPPPIQIGCKIGRDKTTAPEPRGFNDLLLNLSNSIPAFASRFRRIIEIVSSDESAKNASREQYKLYRQRQFDIHVHQM